MATQITGQVVMHDAASNAVTELRWSGSTDCTDLRIRVTTPSGGEFLGIASLDGNGGFEIVFVVDDDFASGDVMCDDTLDVAFECRNAGVWQPDGATRQLIDCNRRPQCDLTIESMTAREASAGSDVPEFVTVAGTAEECDSVKVTITSANGVSISRSADVTDGTWSVTFRRDVDSELKDFECGSDVNIFVECKDDRNCTATATLSLDCLPACPAVVLEVRSPAGDLLTPDNEILHCATAGDYEISVVSPPVAQVERYEWRRGGVVIDGAAGPQLVETVPASAAVTISVLVFMTNGCVVPATLTFSCEPTVVRPPPRDPRPRPDEDDPPDRVVIPPDDTGVCGPCCIWFIANIIAVFAVLVAVVIAGCVFQFLEPISTGTAIVLGILTLISIIAWAIFCSNSAVSCRQILRWLDIVRWLRLIAAILMVLLLGDPPCAAAFLINALFLSAVEEILIWAARFSGCLPNPWFAGRGR